MNSTYNILFWCPSSIEKYFINQTDMLLTLKEQPISYKGSQSLQ